MIACQSKCWLRSNCGNVAFSLNVFEINESGAKLRNEFLCSAVSATSRALRVLRFPCPLHPSSGHSRAEGQVGGSIKFSSSNRVHIARDTGGKEGYLSR